MGCEDGGEGRAADAGGIGSIPRIQEPERQGEPGPGVAASATPAESDMTMHGVEQ